MFLNAIIFAKLRELYEFVVAEGDSYFLTFAPIATAFRNVDFDFLDPNPQSADEIRLNAENKMAFSQISNAVVRDKKLFRINNDEGLENAYRIFLENALLIDPAISDQEKAAFAAAKVVLFLNDNLDPTPAYAKYKDFARKHAELEAEILDIHAKVADGNADPALSVEKAELELKRLVVFNDWLITGEKTVIDKALDTVTGINERAIFRQNFAQQRQGLKTAITTETTINSNIEYLPTFCLPNKIHQYDYPGWKKVIISSEDIAKLQTAAREFLGEAAYNSSSSSSPTPVTRIEFEYLLVSIQRSWFRKDVVNSRFWNFSASDGTKISNGADLFNGLLPAVLDKFLFVRRITQFASPGDVAAMKPEVHAIVPPTYKFRDIASMRDLSKIKNLPPEENDISKFKFSGQHLGPQASVLKIETASLPVAVVPTLGVPEPPFSFHVFPKKVQKFTINPDLLANAVLHPPVIQSNPAAPALFSLTFTCTDGPNTVGSQEVALTNQADGSTFAAETDNSGRVTFRGMPSGNYRLMIADSEVYEDFVNTYSISSDFAASVTLSKRENPAFTMWLLGAVNYSFPDLPNPIPGAVYE